MLPMKKKRKYNEHVLEVGNGTFTPLVFSIFGGMGKECQMFYKRLYHRLSEKRGEEVAVLTSWVRTSLSFALLRSVLMAIRGSRRPFYKRDISNADIIIDVE